MIGSLIACLDNFELVLDHEGVGGLVELPHVDKGLLAACQTEQRAVVIADGARGEDGSDGSSIVVEAHELGVNSPVRGLLGGWLT